MIKKVKEIKKVKKCYMFCQNTDMIKHFHKKPIY